MIGELLDDLERQIFDATDRGIPKQLMAEIRKAPPDSPVSSTGLDQSVGRQLALRAELTDRRDRAVELHRRLIEQLTPLLDDATLYLVTGYRDVNEFARSPKDVRLLDNALLDYGAIAQLGIEGNLIGGLLAEAATTSDVNLLTPLRERFEAAGERFRVGARRREKCRCGGAADRCRRPHQSRRRPTRHF